MSRERLASVVYVPGDPRTGSWPVRVVKVATRQPEKGWSAEPVLHFRARCDRCGWLGRSLATHSEAMRSAGNHSCLPVAGGAMVPIWDLTRDPRLRP